MNFSISLLLRECSQQLGLIPNLSLEDLAEHVDDVSHCIPLFSPVYLLVLMERLL